MSAAGQNPATDTGLPIGARLDALPFCRMRLAVFGVLTLGLFADIAEVALGNALGAVFQGPPHHLTRTEIAVFMAAIFAGGAIGAPLLGLMGDRFGRRRALQVALLLIAAGSLATAASRDTTSLIAFRFVSGLGIGACPPLVAAYLADIMPPRRRGAMSCLCAGLAFLGAPALILLLRAASPTVAGIEGWRWAVGTGAALAALSAGLLALLPESPRWLATAGRLAEAEAALAHFGRGQRPSPPPAPVPGRDPATAAPVAGNPFPLLCALYALAPWATIGFPLMSGAVMLAKRFSIGDSVVAAALIMIGPVIGNLAAAPYIDRLDRRTSLILCALTMAALGLVFAWATSFAALVAIGIGFSLLGALYASVLALYAAEIVPTGLRASRTAAAWGVGRLVSIVVPLACFALMARFGIGAMFGLIATALLLSAALLASGPEGRTRRALS